MIERIFVSNGFDNDLLTAFCRLCVDGQLGKFTGLSYKKFVDIVNILKRSSVDCGDEVSFFDTESGFSQRSSQTFTVRCTSQDMVNLVVTALVTGDLCSEKAHLNP